MCFQTDMNWFRQACKRRKVIQANFDCADAIAIKSRLHPFQTETWEGYGKYGKAWFSQNYYGLGAIAGWLQEGIAGSSPTAPAYRCFRVAPLIAGGLTYATATIETPFGYAKSAWQFTDGIVKLEVIVSPALKK